MKTTITTLILHLTLLISLTSKAQWLTSVPSYTYPENNIALEKHTPSNETETSGESKSLMDVNTSVIDLTPIYFNFNQTKINEDSNSELEKLYTLLMEDTTIKLEITGHSDNLGSTVCNIVLSYERAKAVADFFMAKGLNSDRIIFKAQSSNNPIATNRTKTGRALNRRVDFKLITNY